jgi:phosphatidylglycerophosphatase A
MKKDEVLTTVFGLGKLPIAPGTFGSLPPVVLYQILGYVPGEFFPAAAPITMAVLLIGFSWICVHYAPAIIAATGKKDPQSVVADEVAGQALVMLTITLFSPANICNTAVIGFILFRLFDIIKPFPCKRLEKLNDGIGILADDLMAGVYASIVFIIVNRLLPGVCG